jgi:hypothetical protein
MSLYAALKHAKSEEDVKDIYIKALGLKGYTKGLIDIQTKEIWFEAKDTGKTSSYAMFTQLLHYVQVALNNGEEVPPFLAVIDTEKAAITKTSDVLPFLEKKTVKWGRSASQYSPEALSEISAHIGTHFVAFKLSSHEDEFIEAVKSAIKTGDIVRTQIMPSNLKQVFDKWVSMIGLEIKGVDADDYALLFYADIMSDGTISTHKNLPAELLHKNDEPVFSLNGHIYELGSREGYRRFWAIYHRPPKVEYRDYLLERRDSLIPIDERSFKGAFFTPLAVVDKAYDLLTETLGNDWQKEYIVWDMCCGVGNLEVKHSNPRNIYMSTLDQADIDVMKATKTCVAAERFQYDYLNDDIDDFGQIDYTLSNKLPIGLRNAIKEGKKILVLINPPYAEASNSDNTISGGDISTKKGVSKTRIASLMDGAGYGYAARELFVQFISRVQREIPNATLAMFSTLKYINAPNFEQFRLNWKAEYLNGFIVHSKVFDGLTGNFPIGFLIWNTQNKHLLSEIDVEILDRHAKNIGERRFYNLPVSRFLNEWLPRLPTNSINIPLKNAVTPQNSFAKVTAWNDQAIGYLWSAGNDPQQAGTHTAIFSSVFSNGCGFYINQANLWQVAVIFAARLLVKHTWMNHNDQFLIPNKELSDEFKTDCLIWMLFNGRNLSAGAGNLDWNLQKWSLVNHFIPFAEGEVESPDRFESDFMVRYLSDKSLSSHAQAVLDAGRDLWRIYFSESDVHSIRDEYKLNRSDVGWYQIRNALASRNKSGDYLPIDFGPFEAKYKSLSDKLRPQVYELGFLKI